MHNNTKNIVFICDNTYVKPTIVTITSLFLNGRKNENYIINILTSNLSDANIRLLHQLKNAKVKINIIDKSNLVSNFSNIDQNRHVTAAAVLKFYIPEIFPTLDKILYLDSDIIIQKDLKKLFDLNIDNYYAAVVKDILPIINTKHMQYYKIDNQFYFNSGVMLLNLKKMREDNITDSLINFRINEKNHFMDQDAFNAVIGHNVKYISYKYNFLNFYLEELSIKKLSNLYNENFSWFPSLIYKECFIIHFGGEYKPWVYNLGYLSEIYKKYWKKSLLKNNKFKLLKRPHSDSFFELLFSIKNHEDTIHKVIKILGIKLKIKKGMYMQNNLLQTIFSIKNENCHKVITLLGVKIKFISKKLLKQQEQENKINEIITDIRENKLNLKLIQLKLAHSDDIYQINNTKFYCPNFPIDWIQRNIIMKNTFYEISNLKFLDKYIPNDAVILDIGANIGNHTLYWLTSSSQNIQKVYSFEPIQSTFKILKKNIEINNLSEKSKIFNYGLSDENTNALIDKMSLENIGGTQIKKYESGNLILKKLDDIDIEENHIDLIKIDVEKHELNVLKGALNTIKKYKPLIFVEIFPNVFDDVKALLTINGYKICGKSGSHNYLWEYTNKSNKNGEEELC